MIPFIDEFLKTKIISQNTYLSYRYDLLQFLDITEEKITVDKISLYQKQTAGLSKAARKRKFSAVNQFLLFLYQRKVLADYFQIEEKIIVPKVPKLSKNQLSMDAVYASENTSYGKLACLFILELGLLPHEVAELKSSDIDLTYEILKLSSKQAMRIIPLPKKLVSYIKSNVTLENQFLCDNKGKPYSRQWFFKQIKSFLSALGFPELTAQDLREQFIKSQVDSGKSILELSQILGLKTTNTLEKYYTPNGY